MFTARRVASVPRRRADDPSDRSILPVADAIADDECECTDVENEPAPAGSASITHWHPNADEWQYRLCVTYQGGVTMITRAPLKATPVLRLFDRQRRELLRPARPIKHQALLSPYQR
jgi:hypothetical protein